MRGRGGDLADQLSWLDKILRIFCQIYWIGPANLVKNPKDLGHVRPLLKFRTGLKPGGFRPALNLSRGLAWPKSFGFGSDLAGLAGWIVLQI